MLVRHRGLLISESTTARQLSPSNLYATSSKPCASFDSPRVRLRWDFASAYSSTLPAGTWFRLEYEWCRSQKAKRPLKSGIWKERAKGRERLRLPVAQQIPSFNGLRYVVSLFALAPTPLRLIMPNKNYSCKHFVATHSRGAAYARLCGACRVTETVAPDSPAA